MHVDDITRTSTDLRPGDEYYRFFGVDDAGKTYFYWSKKPGEYAGYHGPNSHNVWGTLSCKNTMLPEHKVFIADLEMVGRLEESRIMRPCYNCRREQNKRWKAENQGTERRVLD